MKTVFDYFNNFPEPIKTMALENMIEPEENVKSRHDALMMGFHWGKTVQLGRFWAIIHEGLESRHGWKRIILRLELAYPEIMSKYKETTP